MNFWEIYDQYYEPVRKFILATVRDEWAADDLTQETFTRVREKLDTLRDQSKASSWVFAIAHNLCRDHFRSVKKTSPRAGSEEGEVELACEASVQLKLEQSQMSQCIQDKVDLLPESHRTVIILFDVMGFTHQEVADVLGISVENAKVRLHRARRQLKSILEEHCTFEVDERNVLTCEPQEMSTS